MRTILRILALALTVGTAHAQVSGGVSNPIGYSPNPFTVGSGQVYLGTLATNNGNTFLGAEQQTPANFTGTESTFVGDRAGGCITSGSFSTVGGHNAAGIGGGCNSGAGIYFDSSTVWGTDSLRNTNGNDQVDAFGDGVLKAYNQVGTAGNHYAHGSVGLGSGSLANWNAAVAYPYNTAVGNGSCQGAGSGTISFTGGTCLGAAVGAALTTASNFLLISGGTAGWAGRSTFASGSGVIIVGSGKYNLDTPAAGTSNFINIENTYIASTSPGAYVSGFGNGAGYGGGNTSKRFLFNVGTGGTASSGTFSFPTAAPTGWYCTGYDNTNSGLYREVFTPVSTTNVTVTNYAPGGTTATPWTSGDQLTVSCDGY